MTSDISTKTQVCGVTMRINQCKRLYLGVPLRFVLTGLSVLLLSILTVPSYALDSAPMPGVAINPLLSGARAGILTKAQGAMLVIDRTEYRLAPIAVVQDRFGTPLSIQDLQCHDVQYRVQYWTVPDLGHDQVMQLIVSFPE
jgi:hypothetical protein